MINTYQQAQAFLYSFIPKNVTFTYPGKKGLERTRLFFKFINNPDYNFPIIHIAGTSGKGSTAIIISQILKSHQLKTGLHISPHFYDIRERFQIDNQLITKKEFIKFVLLLKQQISLFEKKYNLKPTFFELTVILSAIIFKEKKVDIGVYETGMGGLFDATNALSSKNKICVITDIGLDHEQILGGNIESISKQKIGIIHKNNQVIAIKQGKIIDSIINNKAKKTKSQLLFIDPLDIKNLTINRYGSTFSINSPNLQIKNLKLNLIGDYQTKNCYLAILTCQRFLQQDKILFKYNLLKRGIININNPGRFEIINYKDQLIIFDIAHNQQKINAFLFNLTNLIPNKKFILIISFKRTKKYKPMLDLMIPYAKKMILTNVYLIQTKRTKISYSPKILKQYLTNHNFLQTKIINNPGKAFEYTLKTFPKDIIVITGSLFLVNQLRSKFK